MRIEPLRAKDIDTRREYATEQPGSAFLFRREEYKNPDTRMGKLMAINKDDLGRPLLL